MRLPAASASSKQELSRGQFAEASLLSVKALRLYEERGLLVPVRTDPGSGYRYYTAEQAGTGRLIAVLRRAGASLDEIARVVQAVDRESAARALNKVGERLRDHSTAAHALLAQARAELAQDHDWRAVTAEALHLPEQVTLGVIGSVDVRRLVEHVEEEVAVLQDQAVDLGVEVVGDPFGIFHGPVDADSAGPLEVLLPVSRLTAAAGRVRCQRTPGGLFAATSVEGEQAQFPAVLAAYAAAGSWLDRHQHARVGPPRELWRDHADPAAAIVVAIPYVPTTTSIDR